MIRLEGREGVLAAVALTLMNLLIFYSSVWAGLIASVGVIASWLLVGIAGYIAGRSCSPILMVLEATAIILLRMIRMPALVSKSYITQSLGVIMAIYLIGLMSGLLLVGRRGYRELINVSWINSVPLAVGSAGAAIISKSIINGIVTLLGSHAPLFITLNILNSPYIAVSVAIFSITYSVLVSNSMLGLGKSLVLAGLISFALPLTLPLAIVPQGLIHGEEGLSIVREKCVEVGSLRKVVIRGRSCIKPCFSFNVGENNHLIITGSSGTGKTTIAKLLASEARRLGINVIILDVHGEYRDLPGSLTISPVRHSVNILSLMGRSPSVRAEEVADLIASAYKLGSVQKAALQHMIVYAYRIYAAPTIKELIEIASDPRAPDYLGFSKDVIRSLLPYLRSLTSIEISDSWLDPSVLARGLTVVDLSSVESHSLQQVYVESLLDSVFIYQRTSPSPLIIIIEEAHRFTGRSNSSIMRLFREGRKFGINVTVITQEPYSLDPSIINNCGAIISTQLTENRAVTYMSKVVSGGDQRIFKKVRSVLSSLNRFEAIVWTREGCLYLIRVKP